MAKAVLPLKESILDAMTVAETSVEAAQYLATRVREIFTKAKVLDQFQDVMLKVDEFAQYTAFRLTASTQPWAGEQVQGSGFENMQQNAANDAVNHLANYIEPGQNIQFAIAINDDAQFLRGYAVDGDDMEKDAVACFNKLFEDWLAEHNLISKNSTLFVADDHGSLKKDKAGSPIKADAQQLKELISGNQGYSSYLANKGINLSIQLMPYPGSTQQAQKQQELNKAIDAIPASAAETRDNANHHTGPRA